MPLTFADVMREKGYGVVEARHIYIVALCIECERFNTIGLASDWQHREMECAFCRVRFTVAARVWVQGGRDVRSKAG